MSKLARCVLLLTFVVSCRTARLETPIDVEFHRETLRRIDGWYSWLPSVVWNPKLELYVMVNGGTYAGNGLSDSSDDYYSRWMHTRSGSLGFWYARNPWGPWQNFYYVDEWIVDSAANRTYQPKLSPKWISEDGRTMTLIWSDAMKNQEGRSHTVNYKWNQMDISLQLATD